MENFFTRITKTITPHLGKWTLVFLIALLFGGASCSSNSYAKKYKKQNKKLFTVDSRKSNVSKWSVQDKHSDCPTRGRREKY